MCRIAFLGTVIITTATLGCATSPELTAGRHAPSTEIRQVSEQQPSDESSDESEIAVDTVPLSAASGDFSVGRIGPEATLNDILEFGLGNNPEIQAIHMEAHALEARVPQVRALDDPMLMTTTFLESIQTAAGPQDVILGISQKLPWFGKRALRADAAYHQAQAAFARMAAAELGVAEQIKLAYFELYFIDRAIEVNKELEARITDVVRIATSKYETNSERTGLESVLQAQVELSQLKTMLVQLEQARVKATARLARALHAPRGSSLEIAPVMTDSNVPRTADVLVALIDQCHPRLEAIREESSRDDATIALSHRNYYPDATLGFNWHAIGSSGLSRVSTGEDAFSLMVGFNLPIYKQKLDAALREAQFQAARTGRMYDVVWDELRAEIQSFHAQAIEHDRVIQILQEEILPKSQQTLDLSIEAYQVDRITFQQLIENYKALLRHRLEYYRRISNRQQAIATLERAVGCAITSWPTAAAMETEQTVP